MKERRKENNKVIYYKIICYKGICYKLIYLLSLR